MRRLIVGLIALGSLVGVGEVAIASPAPVAVEVVEAQQAQSQAAIHPMWTRTCGFANCSVYFNKRETRIASYGGALLTQLICALLDGTAAKLACVGITFLVGKAGDNAVAAGRCVKISFSRWTGLVYWVGTYGPSWRCA